MNPFVNPNKRGISLPKGCKNLVDVLDRAQRLKFDSLSELDFIRQFICLVLLQAQKDRATELIIGAAPKTGGTPIRYKVGCTWHEMAAFDSSVRDEVIAKLARMAQLPAGEFPSEGMFEVAFGDVQLRWRVRMTSPANECMLFCIA